MTRSFRFLQSFPNYYTGYREGVFSLAQENNGWAEMERDALGEMPLYYLKTKDEIIASNCISSLTESDGYYYKNIRAVPPRYKVKVRLDGNGEIYHCLRPGLNRAPNPGLQSLTREIKNRLERSIRIRTALPAKKRALFLSGGCDSLTIGYLLAERGVEFTAYTLTIDGKSKDLQPARNAARFLGVELVETDVPRSEIAESVNDAIGLSELYRDYDVYMAVGSFLLARRAKEDGFDSVFTGEGANELFGDYKAWGSFKTNGTEIMGKRVRKKMVWGRSIHDKYYNKQLGSGLGRSLSRVNKILFRYGLKVYNPFLDTGVVDCLLSVQKSVLLAYSKQVLISKAFPSIPSGMLLPKNRLQDSTGITAILQEKRFDQEKLKRIFSGAFEGS